MDDLKITQDMVRTEFASDYVNVFDYRYAEGKHYYNATRRKADNLVAIKDKQEFVNMIPDAVSCIVIVEMPEQEPRLLLTHEFRYPAGRPLISVPAGLIDKADLEKSNPVISAAIREIREETGIEITHGDRISIINPLLFSTPGLTDESNAIVCAHVHITDTCMITYSGNEEAERIGDYMLVTLDKACEYMNNGCDENGYYYSVYTWIALNFFINEMKSRICASDPVADAVNGRYVANTAQDKDYDLRTLVNNILDNNEIDYCFQPIVSAKTGEIIGYEALMRMPQKYGLTPLTLLKYATEEKRLDDVERLTLFNVMEKMTQLKDELGNRKVFINSIPGHYLTDEQFQVFADKYQSMFDRVVIEVTEETNMEDITVGLLSERCQKYGFQVAVDDFGTGYSNVTNLLKFLPNYVKIDRLLISELQIDPRKQHFVNTIIQFAHDNDFLALAEGVETLEELNAVIGMGVDLIQGYFTAKPQHQLLPALSTELLSHISRANLDMVSNNSRQKVYVVKDETQLSLIDLSLQKYNVLLLSDGDLTLVGNPEFVSAVSIRVSDRSKCRLTIHNVSIGDVDTTPCIDLGKKSSLILNIEGNNVFTGNGIRVPGSAELKLEGNGSLLIKPTFTNAYGIGNDYRSTFGKIESEMSGVLEINISGENCICIGGKSSDREKAIDLRSGSFKSSCAASNCVCIGSYQDKPPVYISNMDISINIGIDKGTMIGSLFGEQDTHIYGTSLNIVGAGNHVTGIGAIEKTRGDITISDCSVHIMIKGSNIVAIGAMKGNLSIDCRHCRLSLTIEGNTATGMGCRDLQADITIDNAAMDMSLFSANCILLGCKPESFKETLNTLDIKRDGIVADKALWFDSKTEE
ncbi:MAG: EAL domain-containing protein [Lachnospiraceae bacterium]|nr:EAL domain-containing protein [Lachnospiraceae bacterium]